MANFLEWDLTLSKIPTRILFAALLILAPMASYGQETQSSHWNGAWNAEGTLFRIGIVVEEGEMKVTQIESLGFEWTNQNGEINGNIATVEVDYAGVTGTIQAELIDENTAIVFAASCMPDFMVVCLLSKDRQAVFRKVESNQGKGSSE